MWRTLLALMLLTSPGCAQIAQPSEGATPPAEQPAYAALAAKYFSETMTDRLSAGQAEFTGKFSIFCTVPIMQNP